MKKRAERYPIFQKLSSGTDVSGVTATAGDVDEGKIFVDSTGTEVEGTSTYKADYITLNNNINTLNNTLEPVLLGDGSDTNVYANVSNVTATSSDVAQGKVFVNSTGQEVTGTSVDSSSDLIKIVERQNNTTITLPNGLTKIGSYMFMESPNLTINIPNTVTSIEEYTFAGCTGLSLNLPNTITSIGLFAFNGCTNLALTSLPSGLTSIGDSAFRGCTNLALTNLPSGLTRISSNAFNGCTNLALTSLPSSVTSVGDFAFNDCTNLALTEIPSGITSIGAFAFAGCTGLTEITFLGKPTTIDILIFNNCTNLTTIRVPWSEGEVSGAPWGASSASIQYDYTPE